jgi:hypothetical protein
MKIKVIVRFGEFERIFQIPCGSGDKTFKWLGNIASQRYALAAPNGILRSREDYCGVTEKVQYMATRILLSSGETPKPHELLHDSLRDDDVIVVELSNTVPIKKLSGAPNTSEWSSLAYSASQTQLQYMLDVQEEEVADDSDNNGEFESGDDESVISTEKLTEKTSRINFIKLMLKSQLLNVKELNRQVESVYSKLEGNLKLLKPLEHEGMKELLQDYWDILKDLFHAFQVTSEGVNQNNNTNTMDMDHFVAFLDEANIFPAVILIQQAHLIFQHTISYFPKNGQLLYFDGFLLALILTAQLKFNDTVHTRGVEAKALHTVNLSPNTTRIANQPSILWKSHSSIKDFRRLLRDHCLPLARRFECYSYLRNAFVSDNCLLRIRDHYEILQAEFDKESMKTKDFPTTITIESMCDLLHHCELESTISTPATINKIRLLLAEVRQGSIFGREACIDNGEYDVKMSGSSANNSSNNNSQQFVFPEQEFSFPEFVEAIARAGYYHFSKQRLANNHLNNNNHNNNNNNMLTSTNNSLSQGHLHSVNSNTTTSIALAASIDLPSGADEEVKKEKKK